MFLGMDSYGSGLYKHKVHLQPKMMYRSFIPTKALGTHINLYNKASDLRTRQYLQRLQTDLVEFSPEQKSKLLKLENEMSTKARMQPYNKKTSDDTGLPENIVSMDVIKVAMFLGMIKNKNRPHKKSLIDLLIGKDDEKKAYDKHAVSLSLVPFGYTTSVITMPEDEKMDLLKAQLESEMKYMTSMINTVFKGYITQIQTQVAFDSTKVDPDNFLEEAITFLNGAVEVICDPDETEDEKQELVRNLAFVRSFLVAIMPIRKYKALLSNHLKMLHDLDKPALSTLYCWDARLMLYPGFQYKIPTVGEAQKIFFNLQLQAYLEDLQYAAFDFTLVKDKVCSEALLLCKVSDVLKFTLLKLQNNNIGYLENKNEVQASRWSFYLLKSIQSEVRLWALDPYLYSLTSNLRKVLNQYLADLFRIIYYHQYGHNIYSANFMDSHCKDIYMNLLNNLLFVNGPSFDAYLKSQVQKSALIIPTEYDFFNVRALSWNDQQLLQTPMVGPIKVLTWLFREYNLSDLNKLYKVFCDTKISETI